MHCSNDGRILSDTEYLGDILMHRKDRGPDSFSDQISNNIHSQQMLLGFGQSRFRSDVVEEKDQKKKPLQSADDCARVCWNKL